MVSLVKSLNMRRFLPGATTSGGMFRGMAVMAGGSVVGRLIGIATLPLLTRLYTPTDFGALAVFTAFITMLTPLLTLRYPIAIPLPRSDRLAASLFVLSILCAFVTGALTLAVLLLAGDPFLTLISMEVLEPYLWLTAIAAIASAVQEVFLLWATRRKNFGMIAATPTINAATSAGIKLGFGLAGSAPAGLLIGYTVGVFSGMGLILYRFRDEARKLAKGLRPWLAARLFARFALLRLPAQALLVLSLQAPLLLVATFYTAQETGYFGLAVTAIAAPVGLLSQTASKAFYAEIASLGLRNIERIDALTRSTITVMTVVSLPFFLGALILGKELSVIAFGPNWETTGALLEALSFYMFAGLVTSPVMRLLDVLREQWLLLIINGGRLALIVAVFLGARAAGVGFVRTILIYSVLTGIYFIATGALVLCRVRRRAKAADAAASAALARAQALL